MAIGGPIRKLPCGFHLDGIAVSRTAFESRGNRLCELSQCRAGFRRSNGIEAEEFGLGIADAWVRRRVDQTVARHDAIKTTAANPVVDDPVFFRDVDALDPRARGHDVPIRRLAAIAAMVEPVGLHVGVELADHFARVQVATDDCAGQ